MTQATFMQEILKDGTSRYFIRIDGSKEELEAAMHIIKTRQLLQHIGEIYKKGRF
jgi:hypothetical protein